MKSMISKSAAATDAARRLWARAGGDSRVPKEMAAAAEYLGSHLQTGLGRWIGAAGFRALLERALGLARAEHPALASLSGLEGDEQAITAAVREHGASAVSAGLVTLVAALIDLLGRIIGGAMAVHLVEQLGITAPRDAVTTESQGAPHA